jgi:hypothetical protein
VYHPARRDDYGDHFVPNGEVMPNTSLPFDFGDAFVSRPQIIQELDRWSLLRADGRSEHAGTDRRAHRLLARRRACRRFSEPEVSGRRKPKIDRFGLNFHIGSNPNGVQNQGVRQRRRRALVPRPDEGAVTGRKRTQGREE